MNYVAALVVALHGLIHLLGPAVYVFQKPVEGIPYKTTLLGGRWDVGGTGIRLFGWTWLIAAVGFLVAAVLLAFGIPSWRPLLVGVTIFSLLLTALDYRVAFAGLIVNAGILTVLLLGEELLTLVP